MEEQRSNTAEPDDRALIDRYVDHGDQGAMGILFTRYADLAYRTAYRVTRNSADAEDAVQAGFARIMRILPSSRGSIRETRAWLMNVIISACKTGIRTEIRRRDREKISVEEADTATSSEGILAELGEKVRQILESLPEHYRLPIWLHHYEGLSFGEVATALSVSESTLRSQTSRGIEVIRERLAKAGSPIATAMVLAALSSQTAEAAPATLATGISQIVSQGMAQTTTGSGVASAAASTFSKAAMVKAASVAGIVAVSGITAGTVWQATHQEKPVVELPPISWACNFDKGELPAEMIEMQGGWRVNPTGGPDKSACLETTGEFAGITLDLPESRMPLKITFKRGPLLPEPKGGYSTSLFWSNPVRVAQFFGLGAAEKIPVPKEGEVSQWATDCEYVTRESIDRWSNGKRFDLSLFEGAGSSKLLLIFRGATRIDNLKIETISATEAPDMSMFINAAKNIPEEKKISLSHYKVPEIKGSDKNVIPSVGFFLPTPARPIEWVMNNNYDPAKYPRVARGNRAGTGDIARGPDK